MSGPSHSPNPKNAIIADGATLSARPNGVSRADSPLTLDLGDCRELFPVMRRLFNEFSAESIATYARFEQQVAGGRNYFMPACIGNYEALKVIHSRPANTPRGIERSQSTIIISDRDTGVHLCTISGVEVTPVKTALATMVALRNWLDAVEPATLEVGVIGGGTVSSTHIAQIYQLFPDRISTVRVYSPGGSAARMAAAIASRYPCEHTSRAELLARSNIIIASTTTTPAEPTVTLEELGDTCAPRFIGGIGFNDISRDVLLHSNKLVSEDPHSYSKSHYPLAEFLRTSGGRMLHSLSDLEMGKTTVPPAGFFVWMPYGTAMTDLAVCLSSLRLDPHKAAVQL